MTLPIDVEKYHGLKYQKFCMDTNSGENWEAVVECALPKCGVLHKLGDRVVKIFGDSGNWNMARQYGAIFHSCPRPDCRGSWYIVAKVGG